MGRLVLPFLALGLAALKLIIASNPGAILKYQKVCDLILELAQIISQSRDNLSE